MHFVSSGYDLANAAFYSAQEYLWRILDSDGDGDSSRWFLGFVWEFFGFCASQLATTQGHKFEMTVVEPPGVYNMSMLYNWDFVPQEEMSMGERQRLIEALNRIESLHSSIVEFTPVELDSAECVALLKLCQEYGKKLIGLNLRLDEEFCIND